MGLRVLVAVAYMVLWVLPTSIHLDLGAGAQTLGFFALPILTGLLIARWWAVALAGIQVLSFAVWGDGCAAEAARDPSVECDISWWPLLIAFYVPIEAALIALGVGLRKSVDTLRRRRSTRGTAVPGC